MKERKAPKLKKGTLKKAFAYALKSPAALIAVILLAALTVGLTLVVPILIGDAIDKIVAKGAVDFAALKKIFIQIGGAVALTSLSQWILSFLNNRMAVSVVEALRRDAFEKISRLPLGYIDTHSHGDTVSRIISDAEQFADGLLVGFTQFFTGALTILGTIAFMFVTSWKIALVVVLVTPASLIVAKYVTTHTHAFFVRQAEIRAEQTAFIEEMIGNLKTVQAFSRERANEEIFDETDERLRKASLDATFYSSLTNPSTRFVNNLVYALVALIGGLSIIGGGFTVGGLTKFLAYANQYTKPFNEITGVFTELQGALVCASRIFAFLEEEEQVSDAAGISIEGVEGNVRMEKVDFSYREDKPLIQDLSVEAKAGQKVAIVGPTGCGKTTLVNLLMRFYDVTGGAVLLENRDIRSLTRSSLRAQYGMVLQDTWLKCDTVKENIRMGKQDATDEEVIAAAKAAHAHSFIKRLPAGYDTVLSEDGGNLSQGQKQLLCIARIMLCLPPMLILDEATSSIDTRTEMKIVDAFHTMMKGRTSFIVAHRLSTVQSADVILVMNEGRIVEQGTHAELLSKQGFYATLYAGRV